MLMDQPQNAEAPTAGPDATPEARRALGYNAMARLAGADCGRFVATARYLKGCGLAAPEVLAADVAQGFLVLEDLGDDLYTDVIAERRRRARDVSGRDRGAGPSARQDRRPHGSHPISRCFLTTRRR